MFTPTSTAYWSVPPGLFERSEVEAYAQAEGVLSTECTHAVVGRDGKLRCEQQAGVELQQCAGFVHFQLFELAADVQCGGELVAHPRAQVVAGLFAVRAYGRARFHVEADVIHDRILIAGVDEPEVETVAVMSLAV